MTELISRQKISKRHSRKCASSSGKSLIEAAGRFRHASGKKGGAGLRPQLKRLVRIPRRKKVRTADAGRKADNQKISRRKLPGINWKKPLEWIAGKFNGLNTAAWLSAAGVIVIGAVMAYYINIHIENNRMFDMLSLHQDSKIEDVLYDSLPSDYDGQGSGEVAGIEPVLLTSGEPMSYFVKSGDTLSEIAKSNNIKIGTLISFNKITDVRRLQVGMELKVPEFDGVPYEVKAGDSLSSISKKHNISVNSILDANDLDTDVIQAGDVLFIPGASMNEFDYKKAMGTLFIYPTSGRLSSGFGYRPDPFTGKRRFHNGVDLANATGTRINATMSGRVADIGDRPSGYGKYVIIKHSNGYQSLYAHMNRITVREGQYVYQGSKLGEMGNTGRSTGPHLHFSIYKNNSPVNPLTYLW